MNSQSIPEPRDQVNTNISFELVWQRGPGRLIVHALLFYLTLRVFYPHERKILEIFFNLHFLLFHHLDKADTIYEKLYTQTPAGS